MAKKNTKKTSWVSILGLGISGYETALFLKRRGIPVFVSDSGSGKQVVRYARALRKKGVSVEVGKHSLAKIARSSSVVVSPGIPPRSPLIRWLRKRRVRLLSEIELAAQYCRGTIIAITGTNGKSTVTTLTAAVLQVAGYPAVACGNLGKPFISCIDGAAPATCFVVEVSSFQLFYSRRFVPHVSVILNIRPDHLDWHRGMAEYTRSKIKMLKYQRKTDYAIVHAAVRPQLKTYHANTQVPVIAKKRKQIRIMRTASPCWRSPVFSASRGERRNGYVGSFADWNIGSNSSGGSAALRFTTIPRRRHRMRLPGHWICSPKTLF